MAVGGLDYSKLPAFNVASEEERERSPFRAGLVRVGAELSNNIPLAVEKALGTLTPQKEADYRAGLRRGLARSEELLPGGPKSIDQVQSLGDIGTLIHENLFYSAPQMGASIGGALVARRSPFAGATAAGTPFFVGSNITRATEGGTEPLTGGELARSVAVAPAQALLDTAAERYLPFAGRIFGKGAATQTGGFLKRTAKSIGKAGVVEGVTEATQQAGERFAAGLILTDRDAAREYVQSFGTAFFVGGAMGSFGGFRKPATTVSNENAPTEELQEVVDQVLGLPAPGRTSVTARDHFTVDPQGVVQPELNNSYNAAIPATTPRPFENSTTEELVTGIEVAKKRVAEQTATPEITRFVDLAQQELAARGVNPSSTETSASSEAEAVEPVLSDVSGGAASNSRAPASTPDWPTQRDDLLKGIATRKWYKEAQTPDELDTILRARLEQGSTAKSDLELAARRGIDINAPAAPVEAAEPRVQAETGAAAPVVEQQLAAPAPAAPANLGGGDQSVDPEFEAWWRTRKKGRDKSIRALKPVNYDDLDQQIFRELGEPRNVETLFAKGDQLEALAQERGLLDETGVPTEKLLDMARAQGVVPPTINEAQSQEIMARRRVANPNSGIVSEAQWQQQDVNTAIEAAGLQPARQESDVAALKRMVRDGDIEGAMMGLERVKRGETLFTQPEPAPREPFKGERASGTVQRDRIASIRQSERDVAAVRKVTNRAQAEKAIRKLELAQSIDTAFERGEIDGKQRIKLVNQLQQGRFAEVANSVHVVKVSAPARNSAGEALTTRLVQAIQQPEDVQELSTDSNGVLRYRRGTPGAGTDPNTIRDAVYQATHAWKGAQDIVVADSVTDLPAEIQEAMRSDNAENAYGFVRDGTVYLIADNIPDVDTALAAVYHEGLGHLGLEKLFHKQLDNALEQLYRANPTLRGAVDMWRQTNPQAYGGNLARAIEEVFAEMSERGRVEASWLAKIATIVKALARRMGLQLKVSDSEVRAILAMAHDQIINGKQPSRALKGMRYMMALWHGSPHDFDKFLTEKIGTGEGAQVYGWGLYFASIKDVAEQYRDSLTKKSYDINDVIEFLEKRGNLRRQELIAISNQARYMAAGSLVWRDLRQEYDRDWMDARSEGDARKEAYWRAAIDALDALHDYIGALPPNGKLYQVNVKRLDDEFMDWFEPFDKQSKHVQDALRSMGLAPLTEAEMRDVGDRLEAAYKAETEARRLYALAKIEDNQQLMSERHYEVGQAIDRVEELKKIIQTRTGVLTGADIYSQLRRDVSRRGGGPTAPELASKALLAAGIRGNKYRDQLSRGKDDGTYNYVVFDASDIEIANKYMRPAEINDRAQQVVGKLSQDVEALIAKRPPLTGARKVMAGWMHLTHIAAHYSSIFPQTQLLLEAHADRRATQAVLAHLYREPSLMADKLRREQPAAWKATNELMELTAWDIDYAKSWNDNSHLHGLDNEAKLKRLHADGHRQYNLLKRDGHHQVIDAFRQLNEVDQFASMALAIQQLANMDPELKREMGQALETDPMVVFRNNANLHSAVEARKYWRDVLDAEVKAVEDYHEALSGMSLSEKEAASRSIRLQPIEKYVKEIKKSIRHMEQAPYFHLGRFGKHFVAGAIRLGADKKVDPAAVDHVARELEKAGIVDARISRDLTQPTLYIKVETETQRKALAQVFKRLQKEGWLNRNVEVKDGPTDKAGWLPERTQGEVRKLIEAIKADPLFEIRDDMPEEQQETTRRLRERVEHTIYDVWLNLLPDVATAKVLTHRESKPGFSTDMVRSFAHRFNITVNSLSNMAAVPYIDAAFEAMRGHLNAAKVTGSQFNPQVDTIQTLYDELTQREQQRAITEKTDGIDTWRAITHAFYLGMSPSYVLVNLTQIGVLLWPELAKKHGFVDTAKAIGRASTLALKVMSATFRHGKDAGGWKGAADVAITRDVIASAVDDNGTIDFLMNMIGSGLIDIGSAARELAQLAEKGESGLRDTTLAYAAAAGLYSETFTRLVAALAAKQLHEGEDTVDYAKHIVRESMLEYSTWNNARQMGKMGGFGKYTPVMMSFLQYSTQVTWKLYREMYAAFIQGVDEQQKLEARKFLKSHLAAVVTLAGTLGMPFATVAALALEKLVDAFDDDDEPFDATAAWRNTLSDLFGQAMGEMIARGVPRAGGYGVDLSQRVGEQNLLPFSQFWSDKREFRDASSEAALRSLGAPVSMVTSIYTGFEKIAKGDYLGGTAEFVPNAIKGPVKAYQMTERGYVDTDGNKLPMTPKATAYLAQLLGFAPAMRADYTEAANDKRGRETSLKARATVLRNKTVRAIEEQDWDRARELISEVLEWDRNHPAFAVGPDLEGSLARRAKTQAMSQVTKTPIGANPRDVRGRELTRYANVEYRAQ